MQFRKLEAGDKEVYFALASAFYESGASVYPATKAHIEKTFEELMARDTYVECRLCEEEGEVIGFLLVAKTFSQESGGMVTWIEELYLKEAYRDSGRGAQMMHFIQTNFPSTRFRLETEADNQRAIHLYEKSGYRQLPYIQYVKESSQSID